MIDQTSLFSQLMEDIHWCLMVKYITIGGNAWNELIDLRGKIRKERQEAAREAAKRLRRNQEIAAVVLTGVIGLGLLWSAVYYLVIK